MIRVQRPDAIVVHCQCVHTSARSHRPDFNGLVRGGGHERASIIAHQNAPDVVRMTYKLGDVLTRFRIPQSDNTLWSSAGNDGSFGTEGIYGTLGDAFFCLAHINLKALARSIEIPETYLMVKASRSHPAGTRAGRSKTFDIVAVCSNRCCSASVLRIRPPRFHCHI